MLDSYMNNFENIVSSTLFIVFKITLIVLVSLLILSLILLAIGCLIKSQRVFDKITKAKIKIFNSCTKSIDSNNIFLINSPYLRTL